MAASRMEPHARCLPSDGCSLGLIMAGTFPLLDNFRLHKWAQCGIQRFSIPIQRAAGLTFCAGRWDHPLTLAKSFAVPRHSDLLRSRGKLDLSKITGCAEDKLGTTNWGQRAIFRQALFSAERIFRDSSS